MPVSKKPRKLSNKHKPKKNPLKQAKQDMALLFGSLSSILKRTNEFFTKNALIVHALVKVKKDAEGKTAYERFNDDVRFKYDSQIEGLAKKIFVECNSFKKTLLEISSLHDEALANKRLGTHEQFMQIAETHTALMSLKEQIDKDFSPLFVDFSKIVQDFLEENKDIVNNLPETNPENFTEKDISSIKDKHAELLAVVPVNEEDSIVDAEIVG